MLILPETSGTREIELGLISAFENYPFRVIDDDKMDDFYGYTNFDFLWSNDIPYDMSQYSDATVIRRNIESYLSEKIISVSESTTEYSNDSDEKVIQVFYKQFLDDEGRNSVGLSPLNYGLNAIETYDDIDEFISACGLLYREYGRAVIFEPFVSADLYDSSRYTLYVNQMDLVSSVSDLQNCLRNIDINAYLSECGAKPADSVVIYDVRQAECIDRLLTNENLELWKGYVISRLLYDYSDCLPEKYIEIFTAVNGNSSRENAVKAVEKYCSDELSNIYVKDFCDNEKVEEVTSFAEFIRKAYRDVIQRSENVTELECKLLLEKLDNIIVL